MTTEQKVKKIIADKLGCTVEEVKGESLLCDDLGADSLDVIEIVMELESEFNMQIEDEVYEIKSCTAKTFIDVAIERTSYRKSK